MPRKCGPPWKKPCASQADSPLFQLPLEVRTMILREVLVFPAPIGHLKPSAVTVRRGTYTPDLSSDSDSCLVDYEVGVQWVMEIFSTCQLLYPECRHVFYHENIFNFHLKFELHSSSRVEWYPWVEQFGRRCHPLRIRYFGKPRHVAPAIEHCSKMRFTVIVKRFFEHNDDSDKNEVLVCIGDALRALRQHVSSKEVTFSFPKDINERIFSRGEYGKEIVGMFALLRCSKLSLTNIPRQTYSEIAALVESSKEVVDLPEETLRLWKHLERSRTSASVSKAEAEQEALALWTPARSFQVEKFRSVRDTVLKRIADLDAIALQKAVDFDEGPLAAFIPASNGDKEEI